MPMILATRVRQLRERKGFTKGQLATYAHVSPGLITLMEKGERTNPVAEKLAGIAKALNTTADYLIGLTDSPTPPDNTTEPVTEVQYQIFEAVRELKETSHQLLALGQIQNIVRYSRGQHPPRIIGDDSPEKDT